ncbi:MAG TPA: family 43 glycosylhydrolase [Verrucomicrobiae bacterium]|nr:family 43 glycosylhydrolase [Verrucomicrobiae bacterium]
MNLKRCFLSVVSRFALLALAFGAADSATSAAPLADNSTVHVMATFRGNGEDGLHLQWSSDGYKWLELLNDRSLLKPTVGESRIMRDPCLIRDPKGMFHLVWTTSWTGKTIGYSRSTNLLDWAEPVALPVMASDPNCKLCWAPEIRWDAKNQNFLIYWSSSFTNETPEYWRTYATTTKDFKTFTPPILFFDPGHSQIDASILEADGKFHLFYKHSWQGNRFASGEALTGPYADPSPLFTNDDWEGAWPMKLGDLYVAYIDRFKSRDRMGMWASKDLVTWMNVSSNSSFPRGTLHASVVQVEKSMLEPFFAQEQRELAIEPPKPILEGFTADPHAVVLDDTYYVYPTSDKDQWQTTDFSCWSSKDLIHWKNEGMILDVTRDLSWAKIRAWAPAMIRRDGTYYFYFCAEQKIGVATNSAPTGRFKDALDQPLISPSREYPGQTIDPFAFIDEDGQAYLYYGQGNLYAFKLKPDMMTLDGAPVRMTPRGFNEGVVVFKRKGLYYFMWSENDARDPRYQVAYGTAKSPLGPIEIPRDNVVLQRKGRAVGTAHHSVIQVPGTDRWYMIYHRHAIPNGNGYTRQTCLAKMEFDAEGRIKKSDPLEVVFPEGSKGEPIDRQ